MPSDPITVGKQEAVTYTLRFPSPQTHYVEVEARYPTNGRAHLDLFMAVWTPGSYLIREYERHVENLQATGSEGRATAVEKTSKNRWRVATGGAASVTVTYRVYGREMTVRTNWIEAGFAMLNGAPTFISLVGQLWRPHDVYIELPQHWNASATALRPIAGSAHAYRAESFDTLVDSPIILGNPVQRQFMVADKRHTVVFEGDTALLDADGISADLRAIVETAAAMMGGRIDYPHYHFLNLVIDAGGGLEHTNSFLVMMNRFTTRTRRLYVGYLSLAAHEFFHAWNIKRLRPAELGPFDYEREVYTTTLWICEGFTDYYAALLPRRAGLTTRPELLDELSTHIETLQNTPGRLVTSAAMSSYDTWIKQYRPDENTPNTTVNYYPKGAVIAFLLDARIRHATNGEKSLDDGMRLAYERYSGAQGYTVEQFYRTMSEVAGIDLRPWFAQTAESAGELDYSEALEWFGLRFRPIDAKHPRAGLGATTRNDHGRLVVSQIRRDSPAFGAGLNVDDEIVAIDDIRVDAEGLSARLEHYRAGDTVSLLIARRDRMTSTHITLAVEPGRAWRLEPVSSPTAEQKRHLALWGDEAVETNLC
jgi:predicted metalloprotease with PDZ domain